MLQLDHLAVAAATLEDGRAFVEDALGIRLQPGGKHARYGTHNLLAGLADGLYLEVIAIDPDAPPPADPRWFRLDEFHGAPCLHNWICRTEDIDAALSKMPQGTGKPVDLQRGDLRWQMAVPSDGRLPFDDTCPAVIQWHSPHPAPKLTQTGARLVRLVVRHPNAQELSAQLAPVLTDARVVFETAEVRSLSAEFDVNGQMRRL
jgi:catechol 2,3-dioxygenase-like lactoylglutathione lyase family enzyme